MTNRQKDKQTASEGGLLTPQEQAICRQIAAGQALHSQRALALLALNENKTQAQAAEQAGLSAGQVKYWIAKFRQQRLGVFPDSLLSELGTRARAEPLGETEPEPESVVGKADAVEEGVEEPRAKSGSRVKKKTRKSKKRRKDKKAKRAKKKKRQAIKTKKKAKRARKTERTEKRAPKKGEKKAKEAKGTKKKKAKKA